MGCFTTLTLLLLGIGLCSCSNFPLRTYYYINKPMNWYDAQQYCREKYTDLATFESMDDISRLKPTFSYSWAWIGLYDDPKSWKTTTGNDTNSWRWAITNKICNYYNWDSPNPDNSNGRESCVVMANGRKWFDANCDTYKSYVCFNVTEQNKKNYVYFSTTKSWTSAREYCRQYSMDLAVIENSVENTEASLTVPTNQAPWIGLYRVQWTWSDKSQSTFKNWGISSPDNSGGNQQCVAENSNHLWNDDECVKNYAFICHQVAKSKTTVSMKLLSHANLTDSATNAQILQQIEATLRSQGWTDFKLQWKIQPEKKENGGKQRNSGLI